MARNMNSNKVAKEKADYLPSIYIDITTADGCRQFFDEIGTLERCEREALIVYHGETAIADMTHDPEGNILTNWISLEGKCLLSFDQWLDDTTLILDESFFDEFCALKVRAKLNDDTCDALVTKYWDLVEDVETGEEVDMDELVTLLEIIERGRQKLVEYKERCIAA